MIGMFIIFISISCLVIVVAGILLLLARKKTIEASQLFQDTKERMKINDNE